MRARTEAGIGAELSERLHARFQENERVVRDSELALRGAALGSLWMPGGSFEHLDLYGAALAGSIFEDAHFSHVTLTAARLDRSDLRGARLDHCALDGASLEGADLSGATLTACDLRSAQLSGCRLDGARIRASALTNASLTGATLARAVVRECSLSEADLSEAYLERCLMPRTSVEGVTLSGARSFHRTRALVGEALRQTAEGDAERLRIALLAAHKKDWCWDSWKRIAEREDPAIVAWAHETFDLYPEGGLREALEQGGTAASSGVDV